MDTLGIVAIPGAQELLSDLPPENWAIVTSCPPRLAALRRMAAGLPEPAVLVTADDVVIGKPAPDCFLLAAEKLGVAPEDCIVVEDSAAGIQAGLAAGMRVLGLTTTHAAGLPVEPSWTRPNLVGIRVRIASRNGAGQCGELAIEIG